MAVNPQFFLRDTNPDSPSSIQLRFYIGGNRFVYSLGKDKTIFPELWDANTQRPISSKGISWKNTNRVQFQEMLKQLRMGDSVSVYKLDRLGRSLKDLVEIVTNFEKQGIQFIVLQENIDTSTSTGKLFFHIFCALAEYERSLINERTAAGRQAARAKGKLGGRPKGLSADAEKKAIIAETLYKEDKLTT